MSSLSSHQLLMALDRIGYDKKTAPMTFTSEQIQSMMSFLSCSKENLLSALVQIAKPFARPPISNYYVGCAVLGGSGSVYLGVNLEFLGVALNQSVHGEQFAITYARQEGEQHLEAIAISAAPCGHCRQFMNEIGMNLSIVLPKEIKKQLNDLLPDAFGPKDLGLSADFLKMTSHKETQKTSGEKALEEAFAKSYAPYSKSPSAVRIITKSGSTHVGSYLENAAFNPSLSPFHGALINLVAKGGKYEDIASVTLLEKKEALISHIGVTKEILAIIAPKASFNLLRNN